jgi:hypothetical protein
MYDGKTFWMEQKTAPEFVLAIGVFDLNWHPEHVVSEL